MYDDDNGRQEMSETEYDLKAIMYSAYNTPHSAITIIITTTSNSNSNSNNNTNSNSNSNI